MQITALSPVTSLLITNLDFLYGGANGRDLVRPGRIGVCSANGGVIPRIGPGISKLLASIPLRSEMSRRDQPASAGSEDDIMGGWCRDADGQLPRFG